MSAAASGNRQHRPGRTARTRHQAADLIYPGRTPWCPGCNPAKCPPERVVRPVSGGTPQTAPRQPQTAPQTALRRPPRQPLDSPKATPTSQQRCLGLTRRAVQLVGTCLAQQGDVHMVADCVHTVTGCIHTYSCRLDAHGCRPDTYGCRPDTCACACHMSMWSQPEPVGVAAPVSRSSAAAFCALTPPPAATTIE